MRSLDCVVQGNDDLTLEIVRHLHESGHAVTVLITQNPRCLAFAHTARIRSAPSRPSALGGYDLAVHADGLADGVPDLPPGTLVLRPLQRDGDGPAVLVAAIASQRSSFEIAWMDGQRVLWTASVPLSARDRAGTVVERAHRAALDGLTELVTMLAREEELADTPPPVTTPVETATLRAVHRLHFDIDAATLSALPRAIDFGSHRARCALRLVAGGVGLTVGQIDIAESSETTPGQVLAVSMDSVVIAARNGSVRLGGLHDADGRALDRTAIAALFAVGQTVDGAPPDATVLRRMQAAEAQWTTAIAAIEPARLDFLATLTRNIQPANGTADSCIRQTAVGLPNIGDDRFKPPALSSLVAAVVATAARALDATTVSLALRLPIRPDPFAARLVPLTLAASADRGFAELCADSEVLLSLALSEPMAADLPQRLGRTDWSEQVPVAILTGDGSAPATPLRLRVTLAPGQTNTVQAAALEWSAASLEPAFVAGLADSIATVWNAGCADPDTQLGDLPLLSAEAHAALRASSKGSDVATARDLTLNALLHTAALTYAERPAVSFNAIGLDYTTLHAHVRVLARQIRARTRAHGDHVTVALMFERGIAMVVALLATLEAGAAYLPLDPRDPRPRIAQMIEDAAPVLVLVGAEFEDHLCAGIDQLTVDPLGAAAGPEAECPSVAPDDLAYIIFTSGSTGRPKGAMLTHGGVANRIVWMQKHYGLQPTDRILQKTPYTFDVSVWEFLLPLISGAELVVAPPDAHKDPRAIAGLIRDRGITDIHFVPAMLSVFLGNADLAGLVSLKRIYCSGEALPTAVAAQCRARLAHAELHNLYGPTEASIDVSAWCCDIGDAERHAVAPLGWPVDNTELHILDGRLRPMPLGVPGELCIAGIGVARGYVSRPELTRERFVGNPFADGVPHMARLYRTGDVARRLPDGAIEFLGRRDFQVKIRGFRVELGEIEAVLLEQSDVAQAVVARRATDGRELTVAYLVGRNGRPDLARTHERLRQRLPDYMVPDHIIVLDALPLSANGKLDRKQLPDVVPAPAAAIVSIADPVERELASIWSVVLKRPQIGRTDHFFRLGGNSLMAGEMMLRVEQSLRVGLTFRAVYENAVLCDLAQHIKSDAARPAGRQIVMERL